MKKLIFFCIASAILLFSIIVVNIAPIIGKFNFASNWYNQACEFHSDNYDYWEEQSYPDTKTKEDFLKPLKKTRERCKRKKAMVALEYTALNIDLFVGFICSLLGFLLYLNLGNLGKVIGLIGLGGGIIGFVLTLVYIIESGLVFNDIDGNNSIRIDSDGAFLEWDSGRYKCIFYDKDDEDSILTRFSNYGNKYLNYNKDVHFNNAENYYKTTGCYESGILYSQCKSLDEDKDEDISAFYKTKKKYYNSEHKELGECNKLLFYSNTQDNEKKIIYDRWLTTIILSCFMLIFNIGLAIFGFLLFKDSNGSSVELIKSAS